MNIFNITKIRNLKKLKKIILKNCSNVYWLNTEEANNIIENNNITLDEV